MNNLGGVLYRRNAKRTGLFCAKSPTYDAPRQFPPLKFTQISHFLVSHTFVLSLSYSIVAVICSLVNAEGGRRKKREKKRRSAREMW